MNGVTQTQTRIHSADLLCSVTFVSIVFRIAILPAFVNETVVQRRVHPNLCVEFFYIWCIKPRHNIYRHSPMFLLPPRLDSSVEKTTKKNHLIFLTPPVILFTLPLISFI